MKKTRKNAGVTIAEVVIAMAVIAIVSVAAISSIQASSVSLIKDMSATEVRADAANAVEFFKVADNVQFLQQKITSATHCSVADTTGNRIVDRATIGVFTLTVEIIYEPSVTEDGEQVEVPVSIRAYAVDRDGMSYFDVRCEK